MLNLLIALAPVGLVLVLSEIFWRKKIIKGERARKFIHILAGAWIAFWPHFLPFDGIFVLGCVALALLVYSRITGLFHAIYAVRRKTYGDLVYATAIIACAYLGREPWIFTISILLLALADGAAALVGRAQGSNNQYLVFGNKQLRKSIAGTAAFMFFALVSIFVGVLVGGSRVAGGNLVLFWLLLPASATILENIVPAGYDNFIIPVFATVLLNSLI